MNHQSFDYDFDPSSSYNMSSQGGHGGEEPVFDPYSFHAPQQQSVSSEQVDFTFTPHQALLWNYPPFEYPQAYESYDQSQFYPAPLPMNPEHTQLGSPFTQHAPPTYPPQLIPTHVNHVYPQRTSSRDSTVPTIRVVTDPITHLSPSSNLLPSPSSFSGSEGSFPFPPTPGMSITGTVTPSPISPRTPQYMHSVWDIAATWPAKGRGPPIPQKSYRPHTLSDRKRYVEEVDLEEPIMFFLQGPDECGIPLREALSGRFSRLKGRDDQMFMHRGPSVSIRLKWPGYGNWSRQIPTKDFRSPPGPITKAKLAKNIARTVERFIKEKEKQILDPDEEDVWRVGAGHIGVDDLVLVGLQHVSKGSWQAHLRLARPLRTAF